MTTRAEIQRNFVTTFSAGVAFDALAAVAVATKHDVWSHLASFWFGPFDNIVFGVAGVSAALFLLDPNGEKTLTKNGDISIMETLRLASGDVEAQKGFAARFTGGAFLGLSALSAITVMTLGASFVADGAVSKGLLEAALRHLSALLPIALVIGSLAGYLQLSGSVRRLLQSCALASLIFLVVALKEGRVANYLYHLATNFESLHAWFLALGWAGVFAVREQIEPSVAQSAPHSA